MVHKNSTHAFLEFRHKIKGLHLIILNVLEFGKATQSYISKVSGIPRHILSARINELMFDKQYIKIVGTELENNNPVNIYDLRSIHDKWNAKTNSRDLEIEALKLEIKHLQEIINKFGGVNALKPKKIEKTLKLEL